MGKAPARPSDRHQGETYEIRLEGRLDPRWAARLGVPSLFHGDGTTILSGIAADDQAALHGLLQRIRDLGLKLVAVTRVASGLPIPSTSDLSANQGPEK